MHGIAGAMKSIMLTCLIVASAFSVACTQPAPSTSPSSTPAAIASPSAVAASPSGAPSTSSTTAAETSWSTYAAPDGSFTVEVPRPLVPDDSKRPAIQYMTKIVLGRKVYHIATFPLDADVLKKGSAKEIAQTLMKSYVGEDTVKGTLWGTISGYDTFCVISQTKDGKKRFLGSMVAGKAAWFLEVLTPTDDPDQSNTAANRFMNSFKLAQAGAAASPSAEASGPPAGKSSAAPQGGGESSTPAPAASSSGE